MADLLQYETRTIDLGIEGMTCASCVSRVEKRLGRLDGVEAEVNLATEKARVSFPSTTSIDELVEAVRAAGYTAIVPAAPTEQGPGDSGAGSETGSARQGAPDRGSVAPSADAGERTSARSGEAGAAASDPLMTRLVVSAVLTVPVVVIAMVPVLQFTYWQWFSLALAAPVVVWGGWPFHRATAVNLRHGSLTMDTLVSLGTLTAFAWSLWALFFGHAGMPGMTHEWTFGVRGTPGGDIYLEVAAGVITILLLGRVLEQRSKRRAGQSLRTLLELAPREVSVLRGEGAEEREERVRIESLRPGDEFVVRPGERVAADGVVLRGEAGVDESMLTGEPAPVDVAPGTSVTAATIVHGGSLVVAAERVGADTRLAQIARLVEDAQLGKSRAQRLADRISAVFVPIVIALAAATAIVWVATGSPVEQAITAAVAVLVIACPCALGLATPMAILVGTGRGAERGILITGPDALDRAGDVDTILLDKTGTLTTGRMSLTGVTTADGTIGAADAGGAAALDLAAALERSSEHPVARAIVDGADASGPAWRALQVTEFRAHAGLGVTGEVEGVPAAAGRPAFLVGLGYRMPAALEARAAASDDTLVAVGSAGEVQALIEVGDRVRDGAREAVDRLRALGLRPALVTGDAERPAARVAASLGIDEVHAGVSPEGKLAIVRREQGEGHRVAMVGDGVNDAAALAAADLGIAMGGGTDAAASASDLALTRDEPGAIADAISLARATLRTIKGNLFWAFAYNVAAIPLAAAGFLNPMIAGAAMAFSSVFVVLNSLRLRRA
ncbi:carbonate dehydratase [Agromyces sp. Root1464]|uniref:heavy metal translocating P-type ATPase n=1 Tax=Agromyces sp. Root1464 TaxID=1736467 RepID=UPI0006FB3DF8|nr:heavy metal translocating P-type ATPase [Agromyces sp. Root1464]KQZ07439.1 carbonate dehydratase [Agromyces sp. Root1464]